MPSQKSLILCAIRWVLIVALGVLLLAMVTELAWTLSEMEQSGVDHVWLHLIGIGIIFSCLMVLPAVMLHSLATRRLRGFASCLGVGLALTLFWLGWALPQKTHLYEQWNAAPLPEVVKAVGFLPIALGLLILPFYAARWAMRFTERWLYPRVFQPLESRI